MQLHMWGPTRDGILQKHDFYVAQIQKRIFPQFAEIEREADEFADAEYERLGQQPGYSEMDMLEGPERARDAGQEFYGLAADMAEMMRQSALAGCYHQWDKELREFLEREVGGGDSTKTIWNADLKGVVEILAQFGWDLTAEPFYKLLRATNLIVNVYKHGKGTSLDALKGEHPDYVRSPLGDLTPSWAEELVSYEWVKVSDEDFAALTGALRAFWVAFPERLYANA